MLLLLLLLLMLVMTCRIRSEAAGQDGRALAGIQNLIFGEGER